MARKISDLRATGLKRIKGDAADEPRVVGGRPQPGGEPRATPFARWLTVVIGMMFITAAALIGHDLWYLYQDYRPQELWLDPVFTWLGGAKVESMAVVVGTLLALLGLWFVIIALKPRKRTHMPVNSATSMWVRPVDIARKATATGRYELGKVPVTSRATKKKLDVRVVDDGGEVARDRLAASLSQQMARLEPAPQISVSVTPPVPKQEA